MVRKENWIREGNVVLFIVVRQSYATEQSVIHRRSPLSCRPSSLSTTGYTPADFELQQTKGKILFYFFNLPSQGREYKGGGRYWFDKDDMCLGFQVKKNKVTRNIKTTVVVKFTEVRCISHGGRRSPLIPVLRSNGTRRTCEHL